MSRCIHYHKRNSQMTYYRSTRRKHAEVTQSFRQCWKFVVIQSALLFPKNWCALLAASYGEYMASGPHMLLTFVKSRSLETGPRRTYKSSFLTACIVFLALTFVFADNGFSSALAISIPRVTCSHIFFNRTGTECVQVIGAFISCVHGAG